MGLHLNISGTGFVLGLSHLSNGPISFLTFGFLKLGLLVFIINL